MKGQGDVVRTEPPRSRQSLTPTLCLWAIRVTLLTRLPLRTVQSLTRQDGHQRREKQKAREDHNVDAVTEDGPACSPDTIQPEHQAGPGGRTPQPPGPQAAWAQGPSRQAGRPVPLTFSSSVFEAAFLASDFDRVVCTEPQARASQSTWRTAFMVGTSQWVQPQGPGGCRQSRAREDHQQREACPLPTRGLVLIGSSWHQPQDRAVPWTSSDGCSPASSTAGLLVSLTDSQKGLPASGQRPYHPHPPALPQGHLGECWLAPPHQTTGWRASLQMTEPQKGLEEHVGACPRQVRVGRLCQLSQQ